MNTKKTLLIALLVSVQLCTACGPAAVEPSDTTAAPEGTTNTPQVTTEAPETQDSGPNIPAIDGEDTEFRMLGRQSGDYYLPYSEFLATETNAETMNDAVYKRNQVIEEKYKVRIVADEDTVKNVGDIIRKNVNADDTYYDLYMPNNENAFSLALEGMFVNADNIPYIDTDKPWWQSNMMSNFSISGTNFALIGDMNFSDFIATGCLFFTPGLAEANGIPNLYQTVRDGKWTFDLMHQYCLDITRDLNGDTALTIENDQYGFVTSNFGWQPLFYGTGSRIIEKDENDLPVLKWDSEKNINIITKMTNLINDENATWVSQQHTGGDYVAAFKENRALFWVSAVYSLANIRDMENDFGVLPTPKYDENQDEYYSYVHCYHSSATCVPTTNARLELTGAILEDMAYQSHIIVRPAFYDVTLTGKLVRNEDTVEMLDLLYANLNPDLVLTMKTAGLTIDSTMRGLYTNDTSEFVGTIAAAKVMNEALIQMNVKKCSTSLADSEAGLPSPYP